MSMEELSLSLNADMIAIAEEYLHNKPIPISSFLADFENCGITAIVLSIDYTNMSYYGDIHPIITIVEELAPKSEKPQHPDP